MTPIGGGYGTFDIQPSKNSDKINLVVQGIPGISRQLEFSVEKPPKSAPCSSHLHFLMRDKQPISTKITFLPNGKAILVKPFETCATCTERCKTTQQNMKGNGSLPLVSNILNLLEEKFGKKAPVSIIRTSEPLR